MNKSTGFLSRNATLVYSVVIICVLCLICLPYGRRIINQIPEYEWDTRNIGEQDSKDPFGAKYLDEYLHEQWNGKVYVMNNADSILHKYRNKRINILFLNKRIESQYITPYADKANAGSHLLFVGSSSYNFVLKFFGQPDYSEYFHDFDIKDFLHHPTARKHKKLKLLGGKYSNNPTYIRMWDNMVDDAFILQEDSADTNTKEFTAGITPLIEICDQESHMAVKKDIGKGCITCVSNEILFTNYALQDEDLRIGIEHVIDNTFDKSLPLVIAYDVREREEKAESTSAFMVLLERPATALFLWLMVAAFLLAIFINGRRRRRVEQIRKKSQNSSIDYIKHLATIYTNSIDYSELLTIEKRVMLYKFRKEYYFDTRTRNFSSISQFAEHVAAAKHLDVEKVRSILKTLEELSNATGSVDAKSYRLCLEQLNILN